MTVDEKWPEMRDSIEALVSLCHVRSFQGGWWTDLKTGEDLRKNSHVISEKLMLTVSELAEAMEGHRKDLMDDKLPHRKMMEVELADAMIRICDLAGALKMDLPGAVIEKLEYNSKRPDHQIENRLMEGGKKF